MPDTPSQKLATLLIGTDLEAFVRERRTAGTSWRHIARAIYEATDGQVDVTHETLRNWYPDDEAVSA